MGMCVYLSECLYVHHVCAVSLEAVCLDLLELEL